MSGLGDMLTEETRRAHRARWFVYTGGVDPQTGRRERVPRTAAMRGHWPGYDVVCSCGGWESATGGAIKVRVEEALFDHRYDAQVDGELREEARAAGYDPDDQASYTQFLRVKVGVR